MNTRGSASNTNIKDKDGGASKSEEQIQDEGHSKNIKRTIIVSKNEEVGTQSPGQRLEGSGTKRSKGSSSEAFVGIHLGAGDYQMSPERRETYKVLCKKACMEAMKILLQGGTADEAATIATTILEDSRLVNAGQGSSLTIDKTVECDSGFMSGDGHFGGASAVPGVINPILIARKIADLHRSEPLLSCGRIPPLYLSGTGAKLWAKSNGIPVCDEKTMISDKSEKAYKRYMERLQNADAETDVEMNSEVSDTVGAIALDKFGNVASTVSSGGNWLKHSGRSGHAPVFGCGCWASNGSKNKGSIAVSSSGAGEMLAKVQLPFHIAKRAGRKDCLGMVDAVLTVIKQEFIENGILKCHSEARNVGVIAMLWDGRRGEYAWGHTSRGFVVAHLASSSEAVKVEFSELPVNGKPGKSIQVNGIAF